MIHRPHVWRHLDQLASRDLRISLVFLAPMFSPLDETCGLCLVFELFLLSVTGGNAHTEARLRGWQDQVAEPLDINVLILSFPLPPLLCTVGIVHYSVDELHTWHLDNLLDSLDQGDLSVCHYRSCGHWMSNVSIRDLGCGLHVLCDREGLYCEICSRNDVVVELLP